MNPVDFFYSLINSVLCLMMINWQLKDYDLTNQLIFQIQLQTKRRKGDLTKTGLSGLSG